MTTLIKFMQKKIHISTKTVLQTTSYRTQAQKSKTWIYLLVAIIIILGFWYLSLLNTSSKYIDHYFHLVSYEFSN